MIKQLNHKKSQRKSAGTACGYRGKHMLIHRNTTKAPNGSQRDMQRTCQVTNKQMS